MNKDFDLKNDPQYHSESLRGRINQTIKDLHDETEELRQPQGKTLPIIPVTGGKSTNKYLNNKSPKEY